LSGRSTENSHHHLGYEKRDSAGDNSGNSRNGTTPKTMRGQRGQVQINVPRDRASSFEPQLVKKNPMRSLLHHFH
jgi:putative transposase